MMPKIQAVETDEQREAVYRFLYTVYVEEMGRYHSVADHEHGRLVEPDDIQSRLYFATDGNEVVGTMRLTWGDDASFTERHIEQYDLTPFLAEMPQKQIIIGERFVIAKHYRETELIFRLFCTYLEFVNEKRIQLMFGYCEPYLLNLYQELGFRTYAKRNINSPDTGYLIPLIMIPEDMDHMRSVNSPLTEVLTDFGPDSRIPACVPQLLTNGGAIISQRLTPKESYWQNIQSQLSLIENRFSLFDGLTEEQTQKCLRKSNIIECRNGDYLIKKGSIAHDMYVVLSGTLEIRNEDHVVGVSSTGDVIGEMAFLLESPRTMDVYAVTDNVRVLGLSEDTIKKMIRADSETSAKLLVNVAKTLCYKLLRQA